MKKIYLLTTKQDDDDDKISLLTLINHSSQTNPIWQTKQKQNPMKQWIGEGWKKVHKDLAGTAAATNVIFSFPKFLINQKKELLQKILNRMETDSSRREEWKDNMKG